MADAAQERLPETITALEARLDELEKVLKLVAARVTEIEALANRLKGPTPGSGSLKPWGL